MPRISFDISDQTHDEAQQIAAEMGLSIEEIAASAFDSYLDGVRTTRENDLDEPEADTGKTRSNVTQLNPGQHHSAGSELEGTESWLSTETDPETT